MKHILLLFAVSLLIVGMVHAQAPLVTSPLSLDIGIGGGISLPTGTLSDHDNTGWNAGAKARISSLLPVNIVGSGMYNRLPNKVGSESDVQWMIGAGIEYSIPSIIVHPYLGLDGMVSIMTSTAANASSETREGIGLGAGASVTVPIVGNVDVSVKYQMLNLFGKADNEDTVAQIAGTVMLMFSVL